MSWGNVNKDAVKGSRSMKGIILFNHKQRYHQPYNQNYDSDRLHQVLGKYWFSQARNNLTINQQNSKIDENLNSMIFQSMQKDMEEDPREQLKKEIELQEQGLDYKKKFGATWTSYDVQNFAAEKQIEITRKQHFQAKQEREKSKQQQLLKQQGRNVGKVNISDMFNQHQKQISASVVISPKKPKLNNLVGGDNNSMASSVSTNCSPTKFGSMRPKSAINTLYSDNGRQTTSKKEPFFDSKTTYKKLTEGKEDVETEYKQFVRTQTSWGNRSAVNTRKSQNLDSANPYKRQQKQVNPFKMTTYDTVFGTPFRKYNKGEEHESKTVEQKAGEKDLMMGLVSYKGSLPKNLNTKYKWNSHQYERDNFLRKAPVWTESGNIAQSKSDFKKNGVISGWKITLSNTSKIFHVSERLINKKQQEGQEENLERIQSANDRVEQMDDKFKIFFNTLSTNIQDLSSTVQVLSETIHQRQQETEQLFTNQQQRLYNIDTVFTQQIQSLSQQENEKNIIKEVENIIKNCNKDIDDQNKQEEQQHEDAHQQMKKNIPFIQNQVNKESQIRSERDNIIVEKYSEEIIKLKKEIQQQSQQNSEKEMQLFDQIKGSISKLKQDTKEEQNKREVNEEIILALIENTINKFEVRPTSKSK